MKFTPLVVLLIIATCLFYITNVHAGGLSKAQFLELVRQHRSGTLPPSPPPLQIQKKFNAPFAHLSAEDVAKAMEASKKAQQDEIYSPDMLAQQASSDTVTVEDDEHTKSLKRRAVIALAVFLPLLVLSFIAFFVYIFFFSKGSNRPEKKTDSKNGSKKSANSAGGSHTTKMDSKNGSKNSSTGGDSHTRNNVSTTI